MRFEFDPKKSAANRVEHGIDFEEAKAIWSDPDRLEIPARSLDEVRHLVIASVGGKIWSAFITYRNEVSRVISVRRARQEQEERYRAV